MSEQAQLIEAHIFELNNLKEVEYLTKLLRDRKQTLLKREILANNLKLNN